MASDDQSAWFSNYAVATKDVAHTVAAPGVCITSTVPTGTCKLCDPSGYKTISGTSMAAPHVAGAVALCLSSGGVAGPCAGLRPAQVIERVRADAAARSMADATYGFLGDPNRCQSTTCSGTGRNKICTCAGQVSYYGYLVWGGGY